MPSGFGIADCFRRFSLEALICSILESLTDWELSGDSLDSDVESEDGIEAELSVSAFEDFSEASGDELLESLSLTGSWFVFESAACTN